MTWTWLLVQFFLFIPLLGINYKFNQILEIDGKKYAGETDVLLTEYKVENSNLFHAYFIDLNQNFIAIKSREGQISKIYCENLVLIHNPELVNKVKGFFSLFSYNHQNEISSEIDWQGKCDVLYTEKIKTSDKIVEFRKEKHNCTRLKQHPASFSEGFSRALNIQWRYSSYIDYKLNATSDHLRIIEAISSYVGSYYSSINELKKEFSQFRAYETVKVQSNTNNDMGNYLDKETASNLHNSSSISEILKLLFEESTEVHLMPYFPSETSKAFSCSLFHKKELSLPSQIDNLLYKSKLNLSQIWNAYIKSIETSKNNGFVFSKASLDFVILLRCIPNDNRLKKTFLIPDNRESFENFLDSHENNIFDVLIDCGTEFCLDIYKIYLKKMIDFLPRTIDASKKFDKISDFLTKCIWPSLGHVKSPSLSFVRSMITILVYLKEKSHIHYRSMFLGIVSMSSGEIDDEGTIRFLLNEIKILLKQTNDRDPKLSDQLTGLIAASKLKDNRLANFIHEKFFGDMERIPESLQSLAVMTIFQLNLDETQKREYRTRFINLLMENSISSSPKKRNLIIVLANEIILQNLDESFLKQKLYQVFMRSNFHAYSVYRRLLIENCRMELISEEVCSGLLPALERCLTLVLFARGYHGEIHVNMYGSSLLDRDTFSLEYDLLSGEAGEFQSARLNLLSTSDLANLAIVNIFKTIDIDRYSWYQISAHILNVPMPVITIPLDVTNAYTYFKSQETMNTRGKFSRMLVDSRDYIFLGSAFPIRVDLTGIISGHLKSWFTSGWTTAEYNVDFDVSFVVQMKTTVLSDQNGNESLNGVSSVNGIGGEAKVEFLASTSLFNIGEKVCMEGSVQDGAILTFSQPFEPMGFIADKEDRFPLAIDGNFTYKKMEINFGDGNRRACEDGM